MIKKVLPLLWITSSLVLCGCTNDEHNNYTNEKVYRNVGFQFSLEEHCYLVKINKNDKKIYRVPMTNYYYAAIDLETYYNNDELENEYFINTNELFVYYIVE